MTRLWFVVALLACGVPTVGQALGGAQLPVPASGDGYHCPLERGGMVLRGNGSEKGTNRHTRAVNRYAFDYAAPRGQKIVASRSGVVTLSRTTGNLGGSDSSWEDRGNEIRIRHSDGTEAVYQHLGQDRDPPRVGEFVLRGEVIGFSGRTGWTEDEVLHFAVQRDGVSIPVSFLDFPDKDGVPQEGDVQRPPRAADVHQTSIRRYKAAWRSVQTALDMGYPDLALDLTSRALENLKTTDYYYHRLLEASRASLEDGLKERIDALLRKDALTDEEALLLGRHAHFLRAGPGLESEVSRIELRAAVLGGATGEKIRGKDQELKTLARGLRDLCRGHAARALKALGPLAEEDSCVKAPANAAIERLIADHEAAYAPEAKRLKFEAGVFRPWNRGIVERDAELVLGHAEAFWKKLCEACPSRRIQSITAIDRIERDRRDIERHFERRR